MQYSDLEEVSDSTTGEAAGSPTTTFPALGGPSKAILTGVVNTVPVHRSQGEAEEAAASGASPVIIRTSRDRDQLSHVQRGGTSPGTGPRETGVWTPDDQSLSSQPVMHTTPRESRSGWAPIETDSWEKFEDAA